MAKARNIIALEQIELGTMNIFLGNNVIKVLRFTRLALSSGDHEKVEGKLERIHTKKWNQNESIMLAS